MRVLTRPWTASSDACTGTGVHVSDHGGTIPVCLPFIIMFTILWHLQEDFGPVVGNKPVIVAMVGFVMLSGIIVNNGIVLVDYINQLRKDGMEKRAAIEEAGRARLRPIVMTALTTILGLTTMAMGMGMGAVWCSQWRSSPSRSDLRYTADAVCSAVYL